MNRSPQRPNVLFIMADQHRFDYLGSAGASFLRTPNLDRLAALGTRFTHCTTNCPVCAPARIGLATGLQPSRLGSLDNASYLPHTVPTHYQRFRDHGYRVGCVGKLDLAKPSSYNGRYGDRPCVYTWGFTHPEECEGKMHAGSSPTPIGPYTHFLQNHGLLQPFYEDYQTRKAQGWSKAAHDSVLPADAFEDCYIGRRAAEWIQSIPDDFPWYYFCSFVGPHDPYDPPTVYAEHYRDLEMPPPIRDELEGKPRWVRARQVEATDRETTVTRQQYCGSIEAIDDQVGAILDALQSRGMLEHTYIVFTSDHGEMLGDHGLYAKSAAYEASLLIPLILAGPDIEPGRTSDALVELIDVNPTMCEFVGIPVQENLDARSLTPVLLGKQTTHRENVVSAIRHWRCIRTQDYKLIQNYSDETELYDLHQDPNELHNISARRPDLVRELGGRLQARFQEGQWLR